MFTTFYRVHFLVELYSLTRCISFFTIWTLTCLQFVVAQNQSPGPRANHCAAILGNSMVVFGGIATNNYSFFSTINLPISSQLQWRSLPIENALLVKEAACVVTPENKLFVMGGVLVNNNQAKGGSNTKLPALQTFLQLYDPITQKWTAQTVNPGGPNPFVLLRGHVAVNFSGPNRKGIFVFGGISELTPDDNPTYILEKPTDDNGNSWSVTQINRQSGSPPGTLLNPGISVLGTKVYLIGGTLSPSGQASTSIYSFETQSRKWTLENTKRPLLPPCLACTWVVGNNANRLYVISPSSTPNKQGNSKAGAIAAPVQILSFVNQQNGSSLIDVTQLDNTMPLKTGNDSIPSKGFSAITINQTVILYGGFVAGPNGNETSDLISQFNMSSNTWSLLGDFQSDGGPSTSNSNNPPVYTNGNGTDSLTRIPIILGGIVGCLGLIALVSLFIHRVRANKSKKSQYTGSLKRADSGDDEATLTGNFRKKTPDPGDVLFISGLVRRLSLLNKNSISNSHENQGLSTIPKSLTTVVAISPSEQLPSSLTLEVDKTQEETNSQTGFVQNRTL